MMNILEYIPKDAVCSRLFIVGPYPMSSYVKRLQDELLTKQSDSCDVIVYADESWNESELDKLEELGATTILVQTENPIGLVHAKMYFMECQNKDGTSTHVLIVGSGNASKNGMDNNAEVMTVVRLSLFEKNIQGAIKNYFASFVDSAQLKVHRIEAALKQDSNCHKIILPGLVKSTKATSFYSWLRSGYLFYEYTRDPNFGYILYNMKKGLKGNKTQLRLMKKHGFDSTGGSPKILRKKYIDKIKEEKRRTPNALSKYAVETPYGFWMSKDCYNEMLDSIFPKVNNIDIKGLVDQVNENSVKAELKEGLEKLGGEKYFKEYIDRKSFDRLDNLVARKIKRDRQMALDTNFVERFNFGFASHKMPNLDEVDFDDFCDGFLSTVLIKSKGRVRNLFTQKIYQMWNPDELNILDCENDKKELKKWLIDEWNTNYGEIKKYYKNGIVLIKQKQNTDCGIACIAMVLGLSYKTVLKKAKEIFGEEWGGDDTNNYRTDKSDIKNLIKALGVYNIGNFSKKNWENVEGKNIVAVNHHEVDDTWHWIVAERLNEKLTIYDPERKKGKERPLKRIDGRSYRIYLSLNIPYID